MSYSGPHEAQHCRLSGHDVPHVGMHRSCSHLDEHLVLGWHRCWHLLQAEVVDRAIAVLDDGPHASDRSARGRAPEARHHSRRKNCVDRVSRGGRTPTWVACLSVCPATVDRGGVGHRRTGADHVHNKRMRAPLCRVNIFKTRHLGAINARRVFKRVVVRAGSKCRVAGRSSYRPRILARPKARYWVTKGGVASCDCGVTAPPRPSSAACHACQPVAQVTAGRRSLQWRPRAVRVLERPGRRA